MAVALARALKLAGYQVAAGQVLTATITVSPGVEVPDDLRGLSDAGLHLAAAEALADAGLDDAAQEQLKAALEADPTLDVPEELASPDRREPLARITCVRLTNRRYCRRN